MLYDPQDGGWHGQRIDCPRNPLRPGDPGELPTFWEIAATSCRWALAGWRALRDDRDDLPPAEHDEDGFLPDWFENLAGDLARELLELPLDVGERLLGLAERLASRRAGGADHALALAGHPPRAAGQAAQGLPRLAVDHGGRRPAASAIPSCASSSPPWTPAWPTLAGIVEDGVLEHGFDVINDEDWAAWLRRHGASELTVGREPDVRAPALRSVYDVAFAYLGGQIRARRLRGRHRHQRPAAPGLQLPRLDHVQDAGGHGRRGVHAASTRCCAERGVRFEFFPRCSASGLAPDAARVDEIEIAPPGGAGPRARRAT